MGVYYYPPLLSINKKYNMFIPAKTYKTSNKRYIMAAPRKYAKPSAKPYAYRRAKTQVGKTDLVKAGTYLAVRAALARRRRKPNAYLRDTVPRGMGSTFSKYNMMFKKGTRATFTLLKNNQLYRPTALASLKMTATYGKQAVATFGGAFDGNTYAADYSIVNGSTTGVTASKLFYKEAQHRMVFTNQDITTCYVNIYQLEPRFNIPAGNAPDYLWQTGLNIQSNQSASVMDYTDIYQKPFDSQVFTLFWKVNKIIGFELQQGQSHSHSSRYYYNTSVYGAVASSFKYLRGMSQTQMVVCSGSPLNDSVNLTNVSTSKVAVDIVYTWERLFTTASQNRSIRVYGNTLPPVATGQVVSIGAGASSADNSY